MAERAHPKISGFECKFFGIIKGKYAKNLYKRYNFANKYVKGKKVVDIPCGVGWGTSLLKKANHIIGIDISEEAIEYAKKYSNKNSEYFVGNMESINLENNSTDVVICLEGFEHVSKEIGIKFLKECTRILVPNGLLIMTCPILNEFGESTGNPYHLYEYPEKELIDILNKNFRILTLERMDGPDGPEYRAVLLNSN